MIETRRLKNVVNFSKQFQVLCCQERLNKGKIPPQLQFRNSGVSQSFETKVRQIQIDQAS